MQLRLVSLDDKYTVDQGPVFMSGIQALVRLPMIQRMRDQQAGLNTAGFISGYRGSPLGPLDETLWGAERFLAPLQIKFVPGINEELAATAVWGSQQANLFPTALHDGVFGMWYGKGPGVDRAMDAFKHANMAGTSRHGGVLAIAGDDHGCQSSTLANQSDQLFAAAMMPILYPATVQEYLDFGIHGFALSRYSGCWVAFKALADTVESSNSLMLDAERVRIALPTDFEMPVGGLNIRWPDPPLAMEQRLHGPRMHAVAAFARANRIDRIVLDTPHPRFGIITSGKAYLDVRQALEDLGISAGEAATLGLRVYKVGMIWPLEESGVRGFADGLEDVLVVEEKRGFLEDQLVRILYNFDPSRRPRVVGKLAEDGARLLGSEGELNPTLIAAAIVARLERLGVADDRMRQRLARLQTLEQLGVTPIKLQRTPFFCSGCPHNSSTRLPEGSRALAGIGCHGMASFIPERNTVTLSQMGGEGACWIGQSSFVSDTHVFQNLGDGTYMHSGMLGVRAAAAAGVNITFKILFNDAVAMTGGQPVEGKLTVPQIAWQVHAEGARRIAVVSEEPDAYPKGTRWPDGTTIHPRDEFDAVQIELREIPGLSILIYDQTCAAEKRRRRKRGVLADPQRRVFINDAVCEGCGDCSTASNCVSVRPLETELGRKRTIDQSDCNKDYSCLKGFCPSFVTVEGGSVRREKGLRDGGSPFGALPPAPTRELSEPYGILVTGVGGSGVLTVASLIGMAAHLEGKGCSTLHTTGMSQKNGAVTSHVRIAPHPDDLIAVRLSVGGADLLLGCDMVVACAPSSLSRLEAGASRAVVNSYVQPTAGFVTNNDLDFETAGMRRAIRNAVGDGGLDFVDANSLAATLLGDSIVGNLLLLGFAFQKGLIPLSSASVERAIELNGVAVETNLQGFRWGRLVAHDPAAFADLAQKMTGDELPPADDLRTITDRRTAMLRDYQGSRYAARYRRLVEATSEAETHLARGQQGLAEAVARNFHKLLAYKDEYEVARLYTDGHFITRLKTQFDGDYSIRFHMAPPLFARRDPVTGHPRKKAYGPWMFTMFRVLASMRWLRGTALDPFGRTAERKTERGLIEEYEATIRGLLSMLEPGNHALAVSIARIPERIRGFGHVKLGNIATARSEQEKLLAAFRNPAPHAVAAE